MADPLPFRTSPGRPGKDEDPAPSKRLGVYVPLAWLPELEEAAKAEGLTPHAAIKLAIWEWMERRRSAKG